MCTWQRASRIQRTSFKIFTCDMHFPDLWLPGVWGLVQIWARRTMSVFWSLPITHCCKWGFWGAQWCQRLIDGCSCSRCPTSFRIGGSHPGEWFLVWPKVLYNQQEASLSQSLAERWGLFSLLCWSSSNLERKIKFLVQYEPQQLPHRQFWESKFMIQVEFLWGIWT